LKRSLTGAAAFVAALVLAQPAAGRVAHTVQPGETLWSIAAASNFTTRALAAANGLPETANVFAGQTIWVPSEAQAATALASRPTTQGAVTPAGAGYVVRPGDTLSAIAVRSGVSVQRLAAINGLDPGRFLLIGTRLSVPGAVASTADPVARPSAPAVTRAPTPTNERVTPYEVSQLAVSHGVPSSLAAAIARQESGFNNALVSSADARGVMQILPGTWDWIQSNLAQLPLAPASAESNVHAGVMYIGHLLRDTGGDQAEAAAAYFQGLSSVRRVGLLPQTRRYVADVMALRRRYGGP
jgi:LysM repeat protein